MANRSTAQRGPPADRRVRAIAGGLALALMLASAASGLRYLWCAPMARAQLTSCCDQHDDRPAAERETPLLAPVCCTAERMATLAQANVDDPPIALAHAPAAAATAVLPPVAPTPVRTNTPLDLAARAGPAPPRFAIHCSYLC